MSNPRSLDPMTKTLVVGFVFVGSVLVLREIGLGALVEFIPLGHQWFDLPFGILTGLLAGWMTIWSRKASERSAFHVLKMVRTSDPGEISISKIRSLLIMPPLGIVPRIWPYQWLDPTVARANAFLLRKAARSRASEKLQGFINFFDEAGQADRPSAIATHVYSKMHSDLYSLLGSLAVDEAHAETRGQAT